MPTKPTDHPSIVQLLCSMLLLAAAEAGAAVSPDAPAMQALAKSLSNLPASWSATSDPCSPSAWDGVTCTSGGRVSGINLASKAVTGQLPKEAFASLSELKSLQLQRNGIVGALPTLAGLASLQSVFLDGNGFSSIPSDFFSGLSALQRVSMDDVPFSLPCNLSAFTELADASALTEFSASNASISGPVPDFFGQLPNLQLLRLSYNRLSGGIPASFAGSSIQQLLLNNQDAANKLGGGIDVVRAMPQLVMVWLQSNAFSGPIPDVSNLTLLESFNVRDNQLTGVVPPSLAACPRLKNVSLSNNLLQGPLPAFVAASVEVDVKSGNNFCNPSPGTCDPRVTALLVVAAGFGYPAALANSWKGNNPCGGGSASWYGVNCDAQQQNVIVLNFANQNYGGVISPAISDLTSLTKIVLSNMNLTGTIPDSLTKLPQLILLDVSNNSLSGKVPSFATSVTLKLGDNPQMESDPGSGGRGGGTGSGGKPGSSTSNNASGRLKSSSSAALIVGMIVALALLGVAIFIHYRKKKKKLEEKLEWIPSRSPLHGPEMVKVGMNGSGNGSVGAGAGAGVGVSSLYSHSNMGSVSTYSMVQAQGMQMSLSSLLKATNNFSEDNIIGRGGLGVIYKGDHNGTIIAVKRNEHSLMGMKGHAEFKAEIGVLKRVRHRNLVSLLGYCDEGQERLLVYEYMSGGTLGQHLFNWHSRDEAPLTWKQRLVIALDVARAIQYLHSLAQESFIHRDLKPSNILLDQDLRAKVSDFGLVKLAEDNQKSMMTRLAGTFGYLAPEYATTGKVTTKVDVYAFGVILMEVITGRKVLDESLPPDEVNLVTVFRRKVSHEKERLLETVDSAMHLDNEDRKSLLEVADLSWHCTAREHYRRPDMSNVVNLLAPWVEQWKPTSCDDDNNEDGDSSPTLNTKLEQWRQHGDSSSTVQYI